MVPNGRDGIRNHPSLEVLVWELAPGNIYSQSLRQVLVRFSLRTSNGLLLIGRNFLRLNGECVSFSMCIYGVPTVLGILHYLNL